MMVRAFCNGGTASGKSTTISLMPGLLLKKHRVCRTCSASMFGVSVIAKPNVRSTGMVAGTPARDKSSFPAISHAFATGYGDATHQPRGSSIPSSARSYRQYELPVGYTLTNTLRRSYGNQGWSSGDGFGIGHSVSRGRTVRGHGVLTGEPKGKQPSKEASSFRERTIFHRSRSAMHAIIAGIVARSATNWMPLI